MANRKKELKVSSTHQISKLVNLLVPVRTLVSSCKKVKIGEGVSLFFLLEVGEGALAGMLEPELSLAGSRETRQRNR